MKARVRPFVRFRVCVETKERFSRDSALSRVDTLPPAMVDRLKSQAPTNSPPDKQKGKGISKTSARSKASEIVKGKLVLKARRPNDGNGKSSEMVETVAEDMDFSDDENEVTPEAEMSQEAAETARDSAVLQMISIPSSVSGETEAREAAATLATKKTLANSKYANALDDDSTPELPKDLAKDHSESDPAQPKHKKSKNSMLSFFDSTHSRMEKQRQADLMAMREFVTGMDGFLESSKTSQSTLVRHAATDISTHLKVWITSSMNGPVQESFPPLSAQSGTRQGPMPAPPAQTSGAVAATTPPVMTYSKALTSRMPGKDRTKKVVIDAPKAGATTKPPKRESPREPITNNKRILVRLSEISKLRDADAFIIAKQANTALPMGKNVETVAHTKTGLALSLQKGTHPSDILDNASVSAKLSKTLDNGTLEKDEKWVAVKVRGIPRRLRTTVEHDGVPVRETSLENDLRPEIERLFGATPVSMLWGANDPVSLTSTVRLIFKDRLQVGPRTAALMGTRVRIDYPARQQAKVNLCPRCWQEHAGKKCSNEPCCRLCSSKDHSSPEHPENAPLCCARCQGSHAADSRACKGNHVESQAGENEDISDERLNKPTSYTQSQDHLASSACAESTAPRDASEMW